VVVVIAELNLPSGVAKISLHTGEEIAIVVTVEEEGAEVGPHTEEALRIQATEVPSLESPSLTPITNLNHLPLLTSSVEIEEEEAINSEINISPLHREAVVIKARITMSSMPPMPGHTKIAPIRPMAITPRMERTLRLSLSLKVSSLVVNSEKLLTRISM